MADERAAKLRERLMQFSLRVVRLYVALPKSTEAQVMGRQFLRSGTSGPAQHREAHRARSDAEFISKLESVTQELDEMDYWLELMTRARILPPDGEPADLRAECSELIAIFVASVTTVKSRQKS